MPSRVSQVYRVALTALPLLAACAPADPSTESPLAPSLAKAASRDIYQAVLVWEDEVSGGPAGIRGDGRNRFGQAALSANEYQGQYCGVWTRLNSYGTAGVEFDADTYYDATMAASCGAARQMSVFLGGTSSVPTVLAPHFRTQELWNYGPGETRLQAATLGLQNGTCVLEFSSQYAGASMVRVTRLPDALGARQWHVESQGNHTAACTATNSKGKLVDTGVRYVLPFAVTITQVLPPAPTFP